MTVRACIAAALAAVALAVMGSTSAQRTGVAAPQAAAEPPLTVPARPGGMAVPHFDAATVLHAEPRSRLSYERGAVVPLAPTREALRALAQRAGPQARLTLSGLDDARGREGLGLARAQAARDILLAAGVAPGAVRVRVADRPADDTAMHVVGLEVTVEQPVAPAPLLALPSDGSVQRVLRRWGAERGLVVIWDATVADVAVTRVARFDADLAHAVPQLLASMASAGPPPVAIEYANRVLRIAPAGRPDRAPSAAGETQ